jgi:pyrroline-5-carboxylate reductase
MDAEALIAQVASAGGTTRAGSEAFEPVLGELVERAFAAAVRRARELAADARRD